MHTTAPTPAQRAAWDAYVALTGGLLPALDAENDEGWGRADRCLAGIVIRIRRYAPMWPLDGPMLVAGTASAIRLYQSGDRAALTALAHAMAHRLFVLSAGLEQQHHRERFERGSYPPGFAVWRDSQPRFEAQQRELGPEDG